VEATRSYWILFKVFSFLVKGANAPPFQSCGSTSPPFFFPRLSAAGTVNISISRLLRGWFFWFSWPLLACPPESTLPCATSLFPLLILTLNNRLTSPSAHPLSDAGFPPPPYGPALLLAISDAVEVPPSPLSSCYDPTFSRLQSIRPTLPSVLVACFLFLA